MTDQVEAVQRMQTYIEEHLTQNMTLADLAQAACFSPWYAARLFKELTGWTPADYIRRLRLSRSALRLRDENLKIIDVALDMGFGSVDGYQRAFFREFGCNPRAYARRPIPLSLFIPYGVKFKEIGKEQSNMEHIQSVFIQVVDRPARKIILKRGEVAEDYWTYCQEVGCDVWGILTSMKSVCGEAVCLWLPERYRQPGTSEYVQGVEVALDYAGPVPEGFDTIELPQAQYLLFQGEPFEEAGFCQAIQAVQTAMGRYDPSVIGYAWADDHPRIQLEPIGARGYIELRAIRPVVSKTK